MKLSSFIFHKILGWKIVNLQPDIDKCIIAIAPHTSNYDFIIGKLAYSSIGRNAHFLIKKEWFVFPFNLFFKSIGGIPVERGKKGSLTDQLANKFNEYEKLQIALTPEGTRKKVNEWKKGFYYIAQKANVPIVLIGFDYPSKSAVFLGNFFPTGDYKNDILKIKDHYKGFVGKHPGRTNL